MGIIIILMFLLSFIYTFFCHVRNINSLIINTNNIEQYDDWYTVLNGWVVTFGTAMRNMVARWMRTPYNSR